MEPQQVLIDCVQAWKYFLKRVDHTHKGLEIGHVPGLVVFGKECAVTEPMVENGLIGVGRPKPEVGQPQRFYRPHRVFNHLNQQRFLPVKVAVDSARGDSGQIADILDAHPFQAILAHSLDGRQNNSRFGVIQYAHFLLQERFF